jgi:hypothetical protein
MITAAEAHERFSRSLTQDEIQFIIKELKDVHDNIIDVSFQMNSIKRFYGNTSISQNAIEYIKQELRLHGYHITNGISKEIIIEW